MGNFAEQIRIVRMDFQTSIATVWSYLSFSYFACLNNLAKLLSFAVMMYKRKHFITKTCVKLIMCRNIKC